MHRQHVGPLKWQAVPLKHVLCTCFLCIQKKEEERNKLKQNEIKKDETKIKKRRKQIREVRPQIHQITLRSKHKARRKRGRILS